jgi:hypothetical protein
MLPFRAYGLSIDSEIVLPELLPGSVGGTPADVSIRVGEVGADGLADGEQLGPFLWSSPREFWLHVPGVARFLVRDGHEIVIDPEPGVDEDSIRVFLLGSALGALLFQRGLLVLHGNAVRIDDGCMICVGHSGAGKSTLAAGFHRRGFDVLADDVVPIDDKCRAVPGFPRIKLWRDVADRLEIDTGALRRIRPNTEKFNLPIAEGFSEAPIAVKWIYILSDDHSDEVTIDPIKGMAKFLPLRHNTYRVRYLDGMALRPMHLDLCGQLARTARLARVSRPRVGFTLEPMIDRILADIRGGQ